jgi:hypothetical protein
MCEHCKACKTCPHKCQPKVNLAKGIIVKMALLIPATLLMKLAKARIKKVMVIQWNSMTPEVRRFYYQLKQMMSTQMSIEELPKEWRGGLTDFG